MLRFLPGLDLLSPPGACPDRPGVMVTFDVAWADRLGMLAGQRGARRRADRAGPPRDQSRIRHDQPDRPGRGRHRRARREG